MVIWGLHLWLAYFPQNSLMHTYQHFTRVHWRGGEGSHVGVWDVFQAAALHRQSGAMQGRIPNSSCSCSLWRCCHASSPCPKRLCTGGIAQEMQRSSKIYSNVGSGDICRFHKWTELNWTELDWTGLDWTGLNWTGLDWTGLDWTELDWTGLDWTRLGYTALWAMYGSWPWAVSNRNLPIYRRMSNEWHCKMDQVVIDFYVIRLLARIEVLKCKGCLSDWYFKLRLFPSCQVYCCSQI